MTESGHTVERRTVLRTLAASGLVAAGSGLGSAGSPTSRAGQLNRLDAAEQMFGDVETVEGLFQEYGQPIVESLADEGFLSTATAPSITEVVDRSEFVDRPESGLATIGDGTRNGVHVIDVRVRQRADGRGIEYHLHPGEETGYAVVTPDGGDASVAVTDGGAVTELASSGCCPDPLETSEYSCDSNCGSFNCTSNVCNCEEKVDTDDTIYHDKEQLCCNVITDTDGNETCECSWQWYDCACPQDILDCPDES